jgi:hypothetical protein
MGESGGEMAAPANSDTTSNFDSTSKTKFKNYTEVPHL